MRRIELDGRKMDSRVLEHQHIKQALGLPDHYGANLDALHDCLGEMESAHITLRYADAMLNALGLYGSSCSGCSGTARRNGAIWSSWPGKVRGLSSITAIRR